MFGSVVALLVGTAILIAACVSQSHASGLAQIADIDDVMQQQVRKRHLLFIRRLTFHARGRLTCEVKLSPTSIDTQMESLRSKISSAFVGLTTASQALGGANSFSYAAFYQVARHLAGQGAFPLISIRNLARYHHLAASRTTVVQAARLASSDFSRRGFQYTREPEALTFDTAFNDDMQAMCRDTYPCLNTSRPISGLRLKPGATPCGTELTPWSSTTTPVTPQTLCSWFPLQMSHNMLYIPACLTWM